MRLILIQEKVLNLRHLIIILIFKLKKLNNFFKLKVKNKPIEELPLQALFI